MNIPRSPHVDRAMAVHNATANLVESYGRLLTDLAAENHALRAELTTMKVQGEQLLKNKDEQLLRLKEQIAALTPIVPPEASAPDSFRSPGSEEA